MTDFENRRKTPDRRKQKIKNFKSDKRKNIRRKKDISNIWAYYVILNLIFILLVSFAIASFNYTYQQ